MNACFFCPVTMLLRALPQFRVVHPQLHATDGHLGGGDSDRHSRFSHYREFFFRFFFLGPAFDKRGSSGAWTARRTDRIFSSLDLDTSRLKSSSFAHTTCREQDYKITGMTPAKDRPAFHR